MSSNVLFLLALLRFMTIRWMLPSTDPHNGWVVFTEPRLLIFIRYNFILFVPSQPLRHLEELLEELIAIAVNSYTSKTMLITFKKNSFFLNYFILCRESARGRGRWRLTSHLSLSSWKYIMPWETVGHCLFL